MTISTHVLDAVTGRPAAGLAVTLELAGQTLAARVTDADGRVADLLDGGGAGVYRLTFDVAGYFGDATFYPEVVVTFCITDPAAHHHVPLLLSPYAYSTYRGS